MRVICYYEPLIPEQLDSWQHKFSCESEQLIELWTKSWSNNGFNPQVLNADYATQHPKYDELSLDNESSSVYNLARNFNYTRSCYRRLVAYSNFVINNGTTLYADYDVMNYSFSVDDYMDIPDSAMIGDGFSCVKLDYKRADCIINTVMDIQTGKKPPKENDLYMHANYVEKELSNPWSRYQYVRKYCGMTHWQHSKCESYKTSDIVHYDNGLYRYLPVSKEMSRYDVIQKIRPVV